MLTVPNSKVNQVSLTPNKYPSSTRGLLSPFPSSREKIMIPKPNSHRQLPPNIQPVLKKETHHSPNIVPKRRKLSAQPNGYP